MGNYNSTRISGLKTTLAALLLFSLPAPSQILCELSLESCIDYAGKIPPNIDITVPKNTTRIAQTPLSVCLPSVASVKPVDFLFTFDLSGSMSNVDKTSRQRITWAQIAALTFLDSLKAGDRVGLMGWTANGDNSTLADTTSGGIFYQKWFPLSSNFSGAQTFIRNNLYLDGNSVETDTYQGQTLVRQNKIPNGGYDDTPLHVSIIVALQYLVNVGGNSNKALIILTDGDNDDDLSLSYTTEFIESIAAKHGIIVYTVGFSGGNTRALQSLAQAGKGQFYFANNPGELMEVYGQLSSVIYNNFATNLNTTVKKTTGVSITRTIPHGGHQSLDGGKYGFALDKVIALDLGSNNVVFTTTSNNTPVESKVAHISVSGPEITALGQSLPPISPFKITCREAATITFSDKNFQVNLGGALEFQVDQFGVELNTQQPLPQGGNQVQLSGGVNTIAVLDDKNRAVVNSSGQIGDVITATWVHPDDPRDLAVGQIRIGDSRVVNQAWIIDGDHDGRADSVFIEYSEPITTPPASITDIHWPGSNTPGKTASVTALPGMGVIAKVPGSNTLVVIDLSKTEFDFGVTAPSDTNSPTLTLDNGNRIEIKDKMGPVIVAAEKKPSMGAYVRRVNNQIVPGGIFPDTLVVTLSEPIRPTLPGQPWNSLFQYIPGGKDTGAVVPLEITAMPLVSGDSLTWTLILPENAGLKAGDLILVNPAAPYEDASGNAPVEAPTPSVGGNFKGAGSSVHVLEPVLGKPREAGKPLVVISGKNGGEVPVVENDSIVDFLKIEVPIATWYPPYGMNSQGIINEALQSFCQPNALANETPVSVPFNCLSIVLVLTKEPYTAVVKIFNNLGHFVHFSVQRFGYCGELNTANRLTPAGYYKSYLVWNQRDFNGKLVGSGVFPWKIELKFESGKTNKLYRRQGIIRNGDPLPACAVSP